MLFYNSFISRSNSSSETSLYSDLSAFIGVNLNIPSTAEELKKEYRILAKQLHPDLGGDTEEFKIMQNEYEIMWERLKNVHTNSKGETYTKETTETPQEFINIIDVFTRLKDV